MYVRFLIDCTSYKNIKNERNIQRYDRSIRYRLRELLEHLTRFWLNKNMCDSFACSQTIPDPGYHPTYAGTSFDVQDDMTQ